MLYIIGVLVLIYIIGIIRALAGKGKVDPTTKPPQEKSGWQYHPKGGFRND